MDFDVKSKFEKDLDQEKILTLFLDSVYSRLNLEFDRISSIAMQRKGIDLTFTRNGNTIYVDEKAQLHYINKDLPTFTFELSYLKNNIIKKGWLFDRKKQTDYYFLVTGIRSKRKTLTHPSDIQHCKITSVNRKKLLTHLEQLGLTEAKLDFYDEELRRNKQFGQHLIPEIGTRYGALHYTERLAEQPINLKLRLDYLLRMKIAKRIFPIE